MKITYGRKEINIKYTYIIGFLFVLLSESVLDELIFGAQKTGRSVPFDVEKYLIVISIVVAFFNLNAYKPFLRNVILIGGLYILFLSLESYYRYNSFFQYPHVFSKIMVLYIAFLLYPLFRNLDQKNFSKIIYIILVVFCLNLLLIRPDILSISSFLNTKRGFTASSTYLLLLLCLYFLNKYLLQKKNLMMILFFITLGLIIFLQHRTVWIATVVALFINFLLAAFKSDSPFKLKAFIPLLIVPLIIGFVGFSFLLSDNPAILDKFVDRIADIQNVETEGTGSWRLQQFKSYQPFIMDNLFAGMRFEGFELPVQFFMEGGEGPVFIDGFGHHFHSFYVDRLFYVGVLGLLLLLSPIVYIVIRVITKSKLSLEEIVLISFVISGITYGLSYNLPVYYFGILGMTLGFIDSSEEETIIDQKDGLDFNALDN